MRRPAADWREDDDHAETKHEPERPTAAGPPAGSLHRAAARRGATVGHRLRAYFLTGVVVAGPLAITTYITWWFINLIDGWVKPFVPARYLPETYLNYPHPRLRPDHRAASA